MCVSSLTIIGGDNGLSPGRRQTIIWTNAGILLIELLGTNFCEIVIKSHVFSFMEMHLKMSSGKWRLFCLGVNVLILLRNFSLSNSCQGDIPYYYWVELLNILKIYSTDAYDFDESTLWQVVIIMVCNSWLLCLFLIQHTIFSDHSEYGISQWETTLHCNVASHWMSAYPE